MMSEPLQKNLFESVELTPNLFRWLRGASPARTSATRESAQGLTVSGQDCGEKLVGSFVKFDRNSLSWRTWQLCLTGDLTVFSETWPRAGTMLNGQCFPRALWARHTHGKDCFLWPTPVAYDSTPGGPNNHYKGLGHTAKHVHGGNLNPRFVEWLMGFPDKWTDLER